jgi:DNA repair exonuclease SbcCD nuclease subunit
LKIIHTADLHLESSLTSNLRVLNRSSRNQELLDNFKRLIDYAKTHEVDRIIIAGDLFDTHIIMGKTRKFILDLIISSPSIDFIYITGNHEEDSFISKLDIIPSNFKFFDNDFFTIHYSDCDITGINYNETYNFKKLNLDPNKINILTIHGDINTNIKLNELKNKNIDYLALGHIHEYTKDKLDDRGVYVYPGCLEGRGFDETGPKGFSLINIVNNKIVSEFVPFARRVIHDIYCDITNCDSYQELRTLIDGKLADVSENDVLKLHITGKYSINIIKQNEALENYYSNKYYFVKLYDETSLKINPKEYENDISLKGEFIRNVLNSDLSEQDKNKVIEFGIKALLKEEV